MKKPFKSKGQPSRKQLRKEKRQQKKVRKNEYFKNKKSGGQFVKAPKTDEDLSKKQLKNNKSNVQNVEKKSSIPSLDQLRMKEKAEEKKLQKQIKKIRNKQLLLANQEEDRNIKRLEKDLKLNKRKSKAIPKSFCDDGLDYLLEICDPNQVENALKSEQHLYDVSEGFDEDLALMNGSKKNKKTSNDLDSDQSSVDDFNLEDQEFSENDEENFGSENDPDLAAEDDLDSAAEDDPDSAADDLDSAAEDDLDSTADDDLDSAADDDLDSAADDDLDSGADDDLDSAADDLDSSEENVKSIDNVKSSNKRKLRDEKIEDEEKSADSPQKPKKKVKFASISENLDDEIDSDFLSENEDLEHPQSIKGASKVNADGTWEDIYGRLRASDGSLITKSDKYIPPAVRAKMEMDESTDKKKIEKLNRLKKILKGSLNRLAESNMHSICSQIEENYMHNSRNDMNETLTNLILESVVTNILAPERLLMEHVLLIIILHANVGTEVGAHFLQVMVKKFDDFISKKPIVEDKTLDNIVQILAQLYNFKLFNSKLIYEILHKLGDSFTEKNVDCILHVLKNVGFNLRKDDPLALKSLILELQKKAATASENVVNGSRVKFLLDILLAIKNNNMSKIPNYDNSYSEHLKKIMKGFIRKGNYISQLNITLEDLLKADEKGKWWVVGSAWTGNVSETNTNLPKTTISTGFSQKLLQIAKKQRMNTDTRRNIFCVIMTAEDYLDAFEKLLHLGLSGGQDREIIHVLLHCCLQEKSYNPYYSYLAQKFCDYDRKYQLVIKFSIWDKLKAISEQSAAQLSNLAKLLIHLIIKKGLPISTLKVVEFNELNKITLRFIRQILLGILLHENIEEVQEVFEKVSQSDKLKLFRESLRLFIHHFLLKNLNNVEGVQKELLETRAKIVEKLLTVKDRLRF